MDSAALPRGWDGPESKVARDFGDKWLAQARSLILLVPSVVARFDCIAVINPKHPEANLLAPSAPEDVEWDERLFG